MNKRAASTALGGLRDSFGDRLLIDEPLARYTSSRIGGPADVFLSARTPDDLRTASRIAWTHDLPLFILGGGSNILISDRGVRGLVIHNRTNRVTFSGTTAAADSGVSTVSLVRQCIRRGLSGLEWAINLPGSTGGAVYGNAGAHDGSMAESVLHVEAVTPSGDVTWANDTLGFEYRSSILKRERRRCVILSVTFGLKEEGSATIQSRADEYADYRKRTQPLGATMGSMFKNPPGDYAGRLIDVAGLKGTRIGGAQVSEKHANFFLNADNATASDVKALVDLARQEVQARFAVWLELEVELVGEW